MSGEVIQMVMKMSILSVLSIFSIKWMMDHFAPDSNAKKKSQNRAAELLKRLGLQTLHNLSDYEMAIAAQLVVPGDITVSWNDIAGLDNLIAELKESVVLPLKNWRMFQSSNLYSAPRGVLFHGPPGCGKTLIAKATAKEAGVSFINLDVAELKNKYHGESEKLASAVFTLATKLQPCIIFIDEIDSFLRSRKTNDHEVTAIMKTQFMIHWDGLSTEKGSTVIVMGATNRPGDLDKAILRRMPAQFYVALPSEEQRLAILRLILKNEKVSSNVNYGQLAQLTNTFSGSDMHELCRNAAVNRIRLFFRENGEAASTNQMLPEINMEDLMSSLQNMKLSKAQAGSSSS